MSTINCNQWSECGVTNGGCCAKGYYGGKPSHGVCTQVCKLGANPPSNVPPAAPNLKHQSELIALTHMPVELRQLIRDRSAVCGQCENNGVHTPLTVKCKVACGSCAPLSKANGKCPKGYWPGGPGGQVVMPRKPEIVTGKKITEIAVIGCPGRYGGASTELNQQITVWQKMGLTVHVVPTEELDQNARDIMPPERGIVVHGARRFEEIKNMPAISFCCGPALEVAHEVKRHCTKFIWCNCMNWSFDREREQHVAGNLDLFLFQSDYQQTNLSRIIEEKTKKPVNGMRFDPFFDIESLPYIDPLKRPRDVFRFGRISRVDLDKFSARQIWIYENATAPVLKKGTILGWNERVAGKCGQLPGYIEGFPACGISQKDFYERVDFLVTANDTTENLPRVFFEAAAAGVLVIADRRGGWTQLIEDGVNGFLCDSDREFSYKMSRAAFERDEAAKMALVARERMLERYGLEAAKKSWAKVFAAVEAM